MAGFDFRRKKRRPRLTIYSGLVSTREFGRRHVYRRRLSARGIDNLYEKSTMVLKARDDKKFY